MFEVLDFDEYNMIYNFRGSKYSPEDMDELSMDIILNAENPKNYIYCVGLNYYFFNIIVNLNNLLNYIDVSYNNLNEDDIPLCSYEYIVTDERKIITLRVRNRDGKLIVFYNANNMFPNMDRCDVVSTWGSYEEAIKSLLGKTKKYPCTLSSLAFRRWQSINNIFAYKPFDCNLMSIGNDSDYKLSDWIRRSYRTGWVEDRGSIYKEHGKGIILDINSLYPYVMKNYYLPTGNPQEIRDKQHLKEIMQIPDRYYFIECNMKFDIKEGSLPYIRIKGDFAYQKNINLETSRVGKYDRSVNLVLTKTDLSIILKNYNVRDFEFIRGFWFYTSNKMFDKYVDYYYERKRNSKTAGERQTNKLFLNALSGALGKYRQRANLRLAINGTDMECIPSVVTINAPCYIHIASAITSIARYIIYDYATKCKDRFRYSDTDSLHLKGWDIPEFIKVSDELGDFKIEHKYLDARYYKKKVYIINDIKKGWILKCTGVDSKTARLVELGLNYSDAPLLVRENTFIGNPKIDWRLLHDCNTDYDEDDEETLVRTGFSKKIREIIDDIAINGVSSLLDYELPCLSYLSRNWRLYRSYYMRHITDLEGF